MEYMMEPLKFKKANRSAYREGETPFAVKCTPLNLDGYTPISSKSGHMSFLWRFRGTIHKKNNCFKNCFEKCFEIELDPETCPNYSIFLFQNIFFGPCESGMESKY